MKNADGKITVQLIDKLRNLVGRTEAWLVVLEGLKHGWRVLSRIVLIFYKIDKQNFVDLLNEGLTRNGITEDYQIAHFLSQCIVESGYLDSTLEYSSGKYLDPGQHSRAASMGHTVVGDGPKYKGRGLIQLTWKNNYKAYSKYCGDENKFVDNPMLIASDMYNAIDASCWFWRFNANLPSRYKSMDMHVLIATDKNDVKSVTRAVNGGENGLPHRQKMFDLIKKEWNLS